ncbi:cation-transporting P-type ATPase [Candidatus Peregrinibacteria bacterium]|nr:cation-transporting P-type ATPase [Candidatus Peregrinibacteria bacterium]
MHPIITYTIAFLLSLTPLSLIILLYLNRIFSHNDPKLGQTTVICTNIIGTLTKENRIVRSIIYDKYKITCPDEGETVTISNNEEAEHEITVERNLLKKEEVLNLIATAVSFCHYDYAKITAIEEILGHFLNSCGISKTNIRANYDEIQEISTHPQKKISTVVIRNKQTKEIFAFSKGNPEAILKRVTRMYFENKKIEITQKERRHLRKKIEKLTKNGQKIIAFAYKPLPLKLLENYTETFVENEMVFLGFIGLTHPLNKKVTENINLIKQSGIKTMILTSQQERKAVAIGKILQIINPQYFEVISGPYLEQLGETKIQKMLQNREKDYIFCELREEDKILVLEALRKNGEKIALAKGKNSIQNIIQGIKKGRIFNKNYRKFVFHALTCKIAETFLFIGALILKAPLPLSIAAIIILDIAVNLLLQLGLKSEQPQKNVMSKEYHPVNIKLSRRKNIIPLLFQGLLMGFSTIGVYFFSLIRDGFIPGETINNQAHLKAMALSFAFLSLNQIISAFSFKRRFKNIYLILSTIIALLLIYLLSRISAFPEIIKLHEISSEDYLMLLFLCVIILIIKKARRYIIKYKNISA